MQRSLRTFTALVVSLIATITFAVSAPSALAGPPHADRSTNSAQQMLAPFGGCEGFSWRRVNSSEIRITALSDDIRRILGPRRRYGLVWINILDRNRDSVESGAYNLSRFTGFAKVFTVRDGWYTSLTVTNSSNTQTLCSGSEQH